MSAEDQRELRELLEQISQDATDAKVMFMEGHLMRLNTLLHKMERKCYVASCCIFSITDLYA